MDPLDFQALMDQVINNAPPVAKEQKPLPTSGRQLATDTLQDAPQKAAKLGANLEARVNSAGEALNEMTQTLAANAEKKTEIVKTTEAKVQPIVQADQAASQDLLSRAQPVFQRRQAFRQRRNEIQERPIASFVKGIFNRNWNSGYIAQEIADSENDIRDIDQEYRVNGAIRDRLVAGARAEGESQTAILNAEDSQSQLGFSLATAQYQQAKSELDSFLTQIETGHKILAMEVDTGNAILGDMLLPEVVAARSQVGKDGFAIVNGVRISGGQLSDRQNQLETQAMAKQAQALALRSADLSYKNQLMAHGMNQTINAMSLSDTLKALQNNGRYNGYQFDIVALQQRAVALQEGNQATAGLLVDSNSTIAYVRAAQAGAHVFSGNLTRMAEANGGRMTPEMAALNTQTTEMIQQYNKLFAGLKEKPNAEQLNSVSRSFAGDMRKSMAAMEAMIDKRVDRMTTNKDMKLAYKSYFLGESLSPEASAAAIDAFVTNGVLPPGANNNPDAKVAFDRARKEVDKLTLSPTYAKLSPAEQAAARRQKISETAGDVFTGAMMARTHLMVPDFAKADGAPVGAWLDKKGYAEALTRGDNLGLKTMAASMGITPEELRRITTSGTLPTDWKRSSWARDERFGFDKMDGPDVIRELRGSLKAAQTSQWARVLDTQFGGGTAQSLADYLNSDNGVASMIRQYKYMSGRDAAGSMLGGLTGGQGEAGLAGIGPRLQSAINANKDADTEARFGVLNQYGADPSSRLTAALAIKGMTKEDIAALVAAVKPSGVQRAMGAYSAGIYDPEQVMKAANESSYSAMKSQILNGKFQDPNLERIRKIAAKDLDNAERQADSFMETMHERDN